MLWVRAFLFSLLIPGVIALLVPIALTDFASPMTGWWQLGWIPVILGVALYVRCLRNFVAAGGTPAIFFTRWLHPVIGSEPKRLVQTDIYKLSRNPMYLAVLLVVLGEAIALASVTVAVYWLALFGAFHLVVTLFEEPHLRARDRAAYERYCQQAPRWIWFPSFRQGSRSRVVARRN